MPKVRRSKELPYIIRLVCLFGCFRRKEIQSILDINENTLNTQYGVLKELFSEKEEYYRIPDERALKPVRIEKELFAPEILWNLYDIRSEYQMTVKMAKRAKDYQEFLAFLKNNSLALSELLTEASIQERLGQYSEKAVKSILQELCFLGVIEKVGVGKYRYQLSVSLNQLLNCEHVEPDQLYGLLEYGKHMLFPALPGYYLERILCQKNEQVQQGWDGCIHYNGYLPHTIYDEYLAYEILSECTVDHMLTFEYLDDNESKTKADQEPLREKKKIYPKELLHDRRYGRTFLTGYCTDNGKIRGYRLDQIQKLKPETVDLKKLPEKLEQSYEDAFGGTWIGGCTLEHQTKQTICLEIRNPEVNERRVRREGITEARDGHIFEQEGKVYYEITVPNPKDLVPWILSLGSRVKIHSVTDESGTDITRAENGIRSQVIRALQKMRAYYE